MNTESDRDKLFCNMTFLSLKRTTPVKIIHKKLDFDYTCSYVCVMLVSENLSSFVVNRSFQSDKAGNV